MNNKVYKFKAVINKIDGIDGAYIIIPFDVEKEFGRKRVSVIATFDGYRYDGSIIRMGMPYHILGVRKDIRMAIGKQSGDKVKVTVTESEKAN